MSNNLLETINHIRNGKRYAVTVQADPTGAPCEPIQIPIDRAVVLDKLEERLRDVQDAEIRRAELHLQELKKARDGRV